MFTEWVGQAWLGFPIDHGRLLLIPPVTWLALILFSVIAACFDIWERRIPNGLNLLGLVFFLALHIGLGSGESGVLAFLSIGVLMLVPTLLGLWGQGDFKMAMVCGAALGVLPTLVIWWLALLLVKGSSVLARRFDVRWLQFDAQSGLPVAAFVLIAVVLLYAGLSFLVSASG